METDRQPAKKVQEEEEEEDDEEVDAEGIEEKVWGS